MFILQLPVPAQQMFVLSRFTGSHSPPKGPLGWLALGSEILLPGTLVLPFYHA